MSELSTKEVMQNKKRVKRTLDEDEKAERYDEKQRRELIARVTDDVEKLGEDPTILQQNLQLSDDTLGKVNLFFDQICCDEDKKGDDYYLNVLAIHSILFPGLKMLSSFSYNSDDEKPVWANCIRQMYQEKGPFRLNLFNLLYEKRKYHIEFVRQISDILRKIGTPMKVNNLKVKTGNDSPFTTAAQFL